MSRLSKNIIKVPAGVEVTTLNSTLTVKGPLGTLTKKIHPGALLTVSPEGVQVVAATRTKLSRSLAGTFASHLKNMLQGVRTKFVKKLELRGIGYRVELQGTSLKLLVGFSHPVLVPVPKGIDVLVEKNIITVSGIDTEAVGQFAANVRAVRKPEPYKGKGLRYEGEYVREKQGKKASA